MADEVCSISVAITAVILYFLTNDFFLTHFRVTRVLSQGQGREEQAMMGRMTVEVNIEQAT